MLDFYDASGFQDVFRLPMYTRPRLVMDRSGQGVQHFDVHVGAVSGKLIVGNNNVVNIAGDTSIKRRAGGPPEIRGRTRPKRRAIPSGDATPLGRDAELTRLEQLVEAGKPVQVTGRPGIGKTTLLTCLAGRVDSDTDVVFLLAAGMGIEDVVQELFQACYDCEHYRPEPARLQTLMATIHALVIVDDFTGTRADLERLRRLLPAATLVVSSAERSLWAAGQSVELGGLALRPALELMEQELKRPLSDEERIAATRFHSSVSGHPLALIQAAAALGDRAGVLSDQASLAGALTTALTEADHAVLRALCATEGLDVPRPIVETLLGHPLSREAVDRLIAARLVAEDGESLRALAPGAMLVVESAGQAPDVAAYAAALAGWAETTDDREIGNAAVLVVRILELAAARGGHAVAVKLARTAAPALCRALKWGSWRRVLVIGAESARSVGSIADGRYFEHEENARRRALGRGALIGTAAGGGFLLGRWLAVPKSATSGAAGCLVAPATLTVTAAVGMAAIVAALGMAASPGTPSAPPAALLPSPSLSVRSSAPSSGPQPSSAGPTTSPTRRPSTRPTAGTPGESEKPHTSKAPVPTTTTTPPTTPPLPSVEGFWGKDRYQIEFPRDDTGQSWGNIVLTAKENGEWKWLYDCNAPGAVSMTERDPVELTCWRDDGQNPTAGTVTRTGEDSVRLTVVGDPDASGFYQPTNGFDS